MPRMTQITEEPKTAWESESTRAFKWASPEEKLRVEQEMEAERLRKTQRRNRRGLGGRKCCKQPTNKPTKSKDDWVLIQTSDEPVRIGDPTLNDVMVAPTVKQAQKSRAKRSKSKVPLVTRDLGDTTFNRMFRRPLPHNYGRNNTRPVSQANYMKTFNIKAAQADAGQVFESSTRAKAFNETMRENSFDVNQVLDEIAENGLDFAETSSDHEEGDPESPSSGCSSAPVEKAQGAEQSQEPEQVSPQYHTFGRPSKARNLEPSMYEILSWSAAA
mmetsp:Transcript_20445/g.38021  ORF Transcript_20445/g.38021 Transcript_20445/m.38021 type:complete len:273 (+) Transcript_20445:214-1032(+)